MHDNPHPNENYLKLEQMAARVIVPLLGAKVLYNEDSIDGQRGKCSTKNGDTPVTLSVKSENDNSANNGSPRNSVAKKLFRPFSMVDPSPSEKESDFDELIQFRQQQRFRYSVGSRLSAVDEGKQSLASSFGSLIDD